MNQGELLRERDRLISVIEEAKTAKTKLKQINILIALYGDDEKVALAAFPCSDCDRTFDTLRGAAMHARKSHGVKRLQKSSLKNSRSF